MQQMMSLNPFPRTNTPKVTVSWESCFSSVVIKRGARAPVPICLLARRAQEMGTVPQASHALPSIESSWWHQEGISWKRVGQSGG